MGQSRGGRYQRYTDKQKATAVLYVEAAGWPNQPGALERVHKQTGIPLKTLEGWVKKGIKGDAPELQEEVNELVEETRQELTQLFEAEMRAIFNTFKTNREEATYRDLGIVLGILTEKRNLLNDKPTQNVQQAITFERRGISTLPEHLAPGTVASAGGSEAV